MSDDSVIMMYADSLARQCIRHYAYHTKDLELKAEMLKRLAEADAADQKTINDAREKMRKARDDAEKAVLDDTP